VLFCLGWLTLSGTAGAEGPDPRKWPPLLADSATNLKAGKYEKALAVLKRLTVEMLDVLADQKDAGNTFGVVLTQRAIAEAGLGRQEEALWLWHTALSVQPNLVDSDLSPFGAPAAFLKQNLIVRPPKAETSGVGAVHPVVTKSRNPKYPDGAYAAGLVGTIEIEVEVDTRGMARAPRVIKAPRGPTFVFAAFEAIKDWRFTPGSVGGEPVPVVLVIEFSFSKVG